MHHRDHVREPGEPGRGRRHDPAPRRDAAAAMLDLQRSAGNRAGGALVARAPAGDTGKTERPEGAARVTLGGIGTIAVDSVQFPPPAPGAVKRGGGGREEPAGGELTFTSIVGPHSSALARELTDGKGRTGRVDTHAGLRVELTNAIVSGYRVWRAGDKEIEVWTLDAEAIELVTRPEGPEY